MPPEPTARPPHFVAIGVLAAGEHHVTPRHFRWLRSDLIGDLNDDPSERCFKNRTTERLVSSLPAEGPRRRAPLPTDHGEAPPEEEDGPVVCVIGPVIDESVGQRNSA